MIENFFKGKRVFITGHTGFKGSWLSSILLEFGAELAGLSLKSESNPNLFDLLELKSDLNHNHGDIRDLEQIIKILEAFKPEIVFHLAAQPLVRESYQNPIETLNTNIMGTAHLLEALRDKDYIKTCVVVTSDKCYSNQEWPWAYRESDPMGGHDPYSCSKGAAELVVDSYRNSFFSHPDACQIATARAGNVIGGGDWSDDRIVVDFIKSIQAGKTLELRHPNAIRPWQHVLEPCFGYLTLAQQLSQKSGLNEAWNFGPNDQAALSVLDLSQKLIKAWGKGKVTYQKEINDLHEAHFLKLDSSKSRQLLKWNGIWSIEKTVTETVQWYKTYFEQASEIKATTFRQLQEYHQQFNKGQASI